MGLFLNGCYMNVPMQPPPHPAETWQKSGEAYNFTLVFDAMKDCGWLPPKENLDENGKIKMNEYKKINDCMQKNGFVKRLPPQRRMPIL